MTREERKQFANDAERVLQEAVVQEVLTEFATNMGFQRQGLPEYGLTKIVSYVAQTARAHALGIPIAELRATPEDYLEHIERLIGAAPSDSRIRATQAAPRPWTLTVKCRSDGRAREMMVMAADGVVVEHRTAGPFPPEIFARHVANARLYVYAVNVGSAKAVSDE